MKHLILIAQDNVGEKMAGPGIRYWEMAKAFSLHRKVYLLTPNDCTLSHPNVTIRRMTFNTLRSLLKDASGVLSQRFPLHEAALIKSYSVPIILDAYDPIPIETLEFFKFDPIKERNRIKANAQNDMIFFMDIADFIVCANERQKDLWTGMLLSLGKITPVIYDKDPQLNSLIDLTPFGISSKPPVKNGLGIREKLHLREKDKVLLWGGGVWNWFDPLTLIDAVALLRTKRDDIHLVFMGINHPNETIPEMKMTKDAVNLAKELNLTDRAVHFRFGWRPYNERQNDLLDATCGVSTHFDNAETRYSFRTRLLDCLWSELPMIVTAGDHFAELIAKEKLGIAVPPQDEKALAEAIEALVDDDLLITGIKKNIRAIKPRYYWEEVIKPIERFLDKNPPVISQGITPFVNYTSSLIKSRGLFGTLKTIYKKLLPK